MKIDNTMYKLVTLIASVFFVFAAFASEAETRSVIAKQSWIHGAQDCAKSSDPAYDIYQHSEQTVILRQSKCLSYEAPFIYVLAGQNKLLVLDTGALDNSADHSLYSVLENLLGKDVVAAKEMLVMHSHGHRDHYLGDYAFEDRSGVTLVKPSADDVQNYFGFSNWPQGKATIDLGGRELIVMPAPGHQEEALAVYDPQTQWLLTGDTLYPGVIYVKNWQTYRESIRRLSLFANDNKVAAIMGAHIEMKQQAGEFYPIGTTYQPDEASLDLHVEHLHALATRLNAAEKPEELVFDDFIVKPMGRMQKAMSKLLRWFVQ